MINSINEFKAFWSSQSGSTQKILNELTDKSLGQEAYPGGRTLGRMAWHLVTTIPEMSGRMGLKLDGPKHDSPVPKTASDIKSAYGTLSKSLVEQVEKNWKDDTLQLEDDMYGEKWKRGLSLLILMQHEIHHRGQMTVLMRQAGLKVPGVMGPTLEDWPKLGMKPPEV